MEWLYENPWPELVACGLLAVLCAILAIQLKQRTFWLGTVIGLGLGMAAWIIDRSVLTDREHVEQSIHDLVWAFQRKDHDGTLAFISPREALLRRAVEMAIEMVTVEEDLRITDVSVSLSNENSVARSHFRVNATVEIRDVRRRHASRWEAVWHKSGDRWLVVEVIELDVLTGSPKSWIETLIRGG